MGLKVDKLVTDYGAALEAHFDALDYGYARSRSGQYGANEWFQDIADASTRAAKLWVKSWEVVFPEPRKLYLKVIEGAEKRLNRVLHIVDHGAVAVNIDQVFENGLLGDIPFNATVVGSGRNELHVVIRRAARLETMPAGTYIAKIVDTNGTEIVGFERLVLKIVTP